MIKDKWDFDSFASGKMSRKEIDKLPRIGLTDGMSKRQLLRGRLIHWWLMFTNKKFRKQTRMIQKTFNLSKTRGIATIVNLDKDL